MGMGAKVFHLIWSRAILCSNNRCHCNTHLQYNRSLFTKTYIKFIAKGNCCFKDVFVEPKMKNRASREIKIIFYLNLIAGVPYGHECPLLCTPVARH